MKKTRNVLQLTRVQKAKSLKSLNANNIYIDLSTKPSENPLNCLRFADVSFDRSSHTVSYKFFDIHSITKVSESGYTEDQEKKTNQDNYFGVKHEDSRCCFIGVCDGHGPKGHVVSKYVVNHIETNSQVLFTNNINIRDEMKTLMEGTQQSLIQNKKNIIKQSGTTLTAALILRETVYLINVGDSKTMLVYEDNPPVSTTLHSLESKEERKFIDLSKAEVTRLKNESGKEMGPLRLFQKGGTGPGLMMSRSLGDSIGHDLGMSVEPEVIEIKCKGNEKYLIIASDGLWDKVTDNDVISIVDKYYAKIGGEQNVDLNECCQELLVKAEDNWRADEDVVDDITIIVVFFKK